jgi:hypothetical protein
MISILFRTLFSALKSRRALALENLALRHQIEVLQRNGKTPRLTNRDRILWVILSKVSPDWRRPLTMVQPDTVVRWHRRGFRLYWKWKSRPRWRVRRGFRPSGRINGYQASADNNPIALAEPLCSYGNRIDSPRMSRSRDHLQRTPSSASAQRVLPVLPQLSDSSRIREGLSDVPAR